MSTNGQQDSLDPRRYGAQYGSTPHGPSGYGQPFRAYGANQAPAPFGYEPSTGIPYSDKSKIAAGLLQIFFGTFGIGRFYMGTTGVAVAQLVLTVVGWITAILVVGIFLVIAVQVWALIDGIVILTGRPVDAQGRPLRP